MKVIKFIGWERKVLEQVIENIGCTSSCFILKTTTKKVWMKTPFDTIMCSKRYTAHLMAIKKFIDNGHTLIDSSAITIDKFDKQLQMVWYPLVLSFIDNYEKDMVPFDIRVAINDVETRAFGAETSNWPPKILEYIHNGRALPIDMLTIDRL